MLELSWNKITSAFLILFFKVLENRLLASDKWLFCMFWKGEEVQGWLATPEWVWCLWDIKQMTTAKWLPKAANSWQRESKAHSCVQAEAWWFGSFRLWPWFREEVDQVTGSERACYQIVFIVSMMFLPYLQV